MTRDSRATNHPTGGSRRYELDEALELELEELLDDPLSLEEDVDAPTADAPPACEAPSPEPLLDADAPLLDADASAFALSRESVR